MAGFYAAVDTPHDMFRFIDAVARRDYALAREIVDMTVNRPKPFALRHLPKPRHSRNVRVILHLGLHKTGSTHLQYQLYENRKPLQENGILFPQTGFGFNEGKEPVRPRGLPGHQALITSIVEGKTNVTDQLLGEVLGSQCHTVVISIENLSQPSAGYKPRAKRIRQVVEALSAIGPVTPVFLYRQPDVWLESYYREISGNGAQLAYQTPGEFLTNNSGLLDFGNIVKAAEDACDNEAVVFSFDDALKSHDDLLFAFLEQCGLDIPRKRIELAGNTRYGSICDAQLHIARMTTLLVPDQATRQNILRSFYPLVEDSGQKNRLFTARERRQIVEGFCASAREVFDSRGIEDPRETWLDRVEEDGPQPEVKIPESYFEALRVAGVMGGTNALPMPYTHSKEAKRAPIDHVTQISVQDLNRTARRIEEAELVMGELNYMRNSVSWRVTAPLRVVMRGYKRLRGRA